VSVPGKRETLLVHGRDLGFFPFSLVPDGEVRINADGERGGLKKGVLAKASGEVDFVKLKSGRREVTSVAPIIGV